jgi:hypothetical protein
MVSKHSLHMKRHPRDRYGRFSSSSSATAPPPSHQEVGSSSHHRTAPPTSRMEEVGSSSRCRTAPPLSQEEAARDDSVEMWVVRRTAPPPLCLGTPPPLARLVGPSPPTHLEEISSDDSLLLDRSGYNDECHHVKGVSLSI